MITILLFITLSITSSINGIGNETYYMLHNDTNMSNSTIGTISMETNHIIEGIPDVLPALQPRFPMPAPSL